MDNTQKGLDYFINSLKINEKVAVMFKDTKYFQLTDGKREVSLVSKADMEKLLGVDDSSWSDAFKKEEFDYNKVKEINSIEGFYAGKRQDIINVKPFNGVFADTDAEYFAINRNDILRMDRCKGK